MIRRDDGDDWLILSQMEHARVAAELARVWCFGSSSTVGATDLLLSAVHDHDEGWRAWELAMQVDPKSGTPRQFTEMPMQVATEIWTKSIQFCAEKHPLPGLWVSSHFVYLGEQSLESREEDLSDVSAVQRFLTAQSRFQEQCRLEALQDVTEREFDALSRFGFTFLRMFDSLSLWLCCAQRTLPLEFRYQNQAVKLIPTPDAQIRIEPYVLLEEPFTISLPARRVPAREYAGDADFQSTLNAAPPEELQWTFRT